MDIEASKCIEKKRREGTGKSNKKLRQECQEAVKSKQKAEARKNVEKWNEKKKQRRQFNKRMIDAVQACMKAGSTYVKCRKIKDAEIRLNCAQFYTRSHCAYLERRRKQWEDCVEQIATDTNVTVESCLTKDKEAINRHQVKVAKRKRAREQQKRQQAEEEEEEKDEEEENEEKKPQQPDTKDEECMGNDSRCEGSGQKKCHALEKQGADCRWIDD